MADLSNKKYVLVTGACGGMGSAVIRELAAKGYLPIAADLNVSSAPEGAIPLEMDVTSAQSVAEAAQKLSGATDSLFAVIHLAGVYTMDSFIEISEPELERMLQVNLMGVYRVNRAFLPFIQRGNGRIAIVTSELAPLDPLPFNGIYSMTKTALASYAHSLTAELNLLGIPVVTLRPGAFGEGMPRAAVRSMQRMEEKSKLYPGAAKRFKDIVISETGAAKDPAVFAKWAVRITGKKRLRPEYAINNSFKLRFFSALPKRAQLWLLKKLLCGRE